MDGTKLQPPQEFPFPFPAYDIQKQFMKELYECLEGTKLGLFESPTGTGKSLSLICGALKWLVDHEKWKKQELISKIEEIDNKIKNCKEPSDNWFKVQTEQIQLNSEKQVFQDRLNAILTYERKKEGFKKITESNKIAQTEACKKTKQQLKNSVKSDKTELDLNICDTKDDIMIENILSDSESSEEENKEEVLFKNPKIFFCSRTHSQLTQFVHELKKSPYSECISVVPLSSRYILQ